MLILFKPWRVINDLKKPTQTWEEAYSEHLPKFSPQHRAVIENIQKLHECKDSRDEHYAQRRLRIRGMNDATYTNDDHITRVTSDLPGLDEADELLALMLDGDRTRSNRIDAELRDAEQAVAAGNNSGLFNNDGDSDTIMREAHSEFSYLVENTDQEKSGTKLTRNGGSISRNLFVLLTNLQQKHPLKQIMVRRGFER